MSKSFQDLPDEVTLKIFSFFTKTELCHTVSLVCKDWWNLSKDLQLWKEVTLDFSYDQEMEQSEERVQNFVIALKRWTILEQLSIKAERGCKREVTRDLICKMGSIPSLKALLFYGIHLKENILKEIEENYPLIEKLKFKVCFLGFGMIDFISSCAALVHLKEFILVNTRSVIDMEFGDTLCAIDFDDTYVEILSGCCPNLEILYMKRPNLTDKGVMALAKNYHKSLRKVKLLCLRNETLDSGFGHFGICQKLISLKLEGFSVLSLTSLKALSELPLLESLTLLGIGDGELIYPAEEKERTAKGFEIFFGNPFRAKLKHVDILSLSVGESALINMSQTCSALEKLELSLCYGITEFGVREVHEKCCELKNLIVFICEPLVSYLAERNINNVLTVIP